MIERDDERRDQLFRTLAETGSEAARTELVESFGPLAEYFAKRYRNRGVEDDDLRQVARMALVRAVDRFDLAFDVKFSTFAGRTIDGELKRYFRDSTWAVRVPRSLQELSLEIRSLVDDLSAEFGRAPTTAELADRSGYDTERILEALDVQRSYRADSTDRPVGGEGGSVTLGERLERDDPAMARAEARMTIETMLQLLPARERTIIELRFFDELSQSEIAERVGVSQMHVSRLIRRSLEELREQAG